MTPERLFNLFHNKYVKFYNSTKIVYLPKTNLWLRPDQEAAYTDPKRLAFLIDKLSFSFTR